MREQFEVFSETLHLRINSRKRTIERGEKYFLTRKTVEIKITKASGTALRGCPPGAKETPMIRFAYLLLVWICVLLAAVPALAATADPSYLPPSSGQSNPGSRTVNVWDGSTSRAWGTAANWSLNHIPTSSEDVAIPAAAPREPLIANPQSCASLGIENGAILTINAAALTLSGDFGCGGSLEMSDDYASELIIPGNATFGSGGTVSLGFSAEVHIKGNLIFNSGSAVNASGGYFRMYGNGNSQIQVNAPTALMVLASEKDSGYGMTFSAASTQPLTLFSLATYAGSATYSNFTGYINVSGIVETYAGAIVQLNQGILRTQVPTGMGMMVQGGDQTNYLHHLEIANAADSPTRVWSIAVQGNVTITSGVLQHMEGILKVGGNWTNNAGTAGFLEGSYTVELNGTGDQTLSDESFSTLDLNKASGNLLIPAGSDVFCNSFDWTAGAYSVTGGNLSVADLVDPAIEGSITLTFGSIEYHQNHGGVYLRADVFISGGTFNFYGMGETTLSPEGPARTFSMSDGILDFKNQSLRIPQVNGAVYAVTGGTIRIPLDLNLPTFSLFQPTGGTFEFYGATAANIFGGTGPSLFNVKVDKNAKEGAAEPGPHANTLTFGELVNIQGNLQVNSGTLEVSYQAFVQGNVDVYGTLNVTWGGWDGGLKLSNNSWLRVFNGGRLEVLGRGALRARIGTWYATDYFKLNILSGGTIAANLAEFYRLGHDGLVLEAGSIVDETIGINRCIFRDGDPNASYAARYLSIQSQQTFQMWFCHFPTDHATGWFNVYRPVSVGTVSMVYCTGVFSGEAHELDEYGTVTWLAGTHDYVPQATIEYFLSDFTTDIYQLNIDYYGLPQYFNIYRSDLPEGPYVLYDHSWEEFWNEVVPSDGSKWFFKITSVDYE